LYDKYKLHMTQILTWWEYKSQIIISYKVMFI
jgi:hypothetical protein